MITRQLRLNLSPIPPKRQVYIHDTYGMDGVFGTYKAFPTLVEDIVKGIHTKTREVRFFRRKKDRYLYIDYYTGHS